MDIAGKFTKVSENPLVIGFIGDVTADKLSQEQIEYIKAFYNASGWQHRMTKDFKTKINQSLYNDFMIIENEIAPLVVEVMKEMKCLAEANPPANANYWIEENRVNIFGYIEDNGNDDRWIALLLEIHGDTFESIEYGTDEVDENELAEKVREILNDYNEKWRIQK